MKAVVAVIQTAVLLTASAGAAEATLPLLDDWYLKRKLNRISP